MPTQGRGLRFEHMVLKKSEGSGIVTIHGKDPAKGGKCNPRLLFVMGGVCSCYGVNRLGLEATATRSSGTMRVEVRTCLSQHRP